MGAAASLSICFKALTTSLEDEFITIAPFFPEYRVFVESNGAKLVVVPPHTSDFQIDFDALEKAISKHTKGVIINSPNNPSGAIYSEETIQKLAALLTKKSKENGTPIFIIADEPYREIAYDGVEVPYVTKYYDNTLVCYSYSKSLSLPGERIGYVLVPDEVTESKTVYAAVAGAGRALGYVCAPSMFQKVIASCVGQTGDIELYKKNRDLLYDGLTKIGYECFKPQGAFYMFVKALEPDADAFCEKAKAEDLLIVSATGFGCPGYARISYCVDYDMIERSFAAFERLYKRYQMLFVSATPNVYEQEHELMRVEQIIRPTGLLDPEISVRPVEGQIDDLIGEVNKSHDKFIKKIDGMLADKNKEIMTV